MLYEILNGALTMGCFSIGLFFFQFWRKTLERLFFIFAIAFWVLALERLVLGYLGQHSEPSYKIYLMRLSAFLLILFAIVDKNRKQNNNHKKQNILT